MIYMTSFSQVKTFKKPTRLWVHLENNDIETVLVHREKNRKTKTNKQTENKFQPVSSQNINLKITTLALNFSFTFQNKFLRNTRV